MSVCPAPAFAESALESLREDRRELGVDCGDDTVMRTLTPWVSIIRAINALRFGHFGPGIDDREDELMTGLIDNLGG